MEFGSFDIGSEIPPLDMLVRLAATVGLAFIIGLERELRGKPAGLRTHMLVSLGAAGFMNLGMHVLFATAAGDPSARVDLTRVIEGVIGGIGFLGAGRIIQGRGSVHGITTGGLPSGRLELSVPPAASGTYCSRRWSRASPS